MSASYVLYTSPNHPPVPDHLPALVSLLHRCGSCCVFTYPWPPFSLFGPGGEQEEKEGRPSAERGTWQNMLMLMLLVALPCWCTPCQIVTPYGKPEQILYTYLVSVSHGAQSHHKRLTRMHAPTSISTPTTTERTISSPHRPRATSAWQSSFLHRARPSGQAEARASRRAAMGASRAHRCVQSSVKHRGTSSGPSQIQVS